MSPLALNKETFPRVTTVVDASLATATVPLAVRALSSSRTVFLSGPDILAYLRNLETAEAKVHEIDFAALKGETPDAAAAAQSKPAEGKEKRAEREDAKIEGAVQIAIGVKKEVDFAAWYTNVGIYMRALVVPHAEQLLGKGLDQGRYARLLQRQWLLRPEALVIQYMGNHPRYLTPCICVAKRDLFSATTKNGLTRRSGRWASKTLTSQCLCHKRCSSVRRITSRDFPRRSLGLHERASMGVEYGTTRTDHLDLEASQTSKSPSRSAPHQKPLCIPVRLSLYPGLSLADDDHETTPSGSRVTEIFL